MFFTTRLTTIEAVKAIGGNVMLMFKNMAARGIRTGSSDGFGGRTVHGAIDGLGLSRRASGGCGTKYTVMYYKQAQYGFT